MKSDRQIYVAKLVQWSPKDTKYGCNLGNPRLQETLQGNKQQQQSWQSLGSHENQTKLQYQNILFQKLIAHQVTLSNTDIGVGNFGSAYKSPNVDCLNRTHDGSKTQEWNQNQNNKHAGVKSVQGNIQFCHQCSLPYYYLNIS